MVEDEVMVHWFLNHGADPNAACEFDQTPLSSAVSRGSFSVIELLFNNGGDASRGELLQSVMRRTTPDQIDVITFLLERGAVVNKIMYQDYAGMYYEMAFAKLGTPLHTAAELGLTDVVALLVERDADPSIEDCRGLTAIDRAEQSGHPNVAEFLRGVPPSTSSSRNYFTRGRQLGLDLIY